MQLIYAELIHTDGTIEKGIFMSMDEFLPYRERGWSSSRKIDTEADAIIASNRNLRDLAS